MDPRHLVAPVLVALFAAVSGACGLDLYPWKVAKVGTRAVGPPFLESTDDGLTVVYQTADGSWTKVRLGSDLRAREVVLRASGPRFPTGVWAFERDGEVFLVDDRGETLFRDRGSSPTVSPLGGASSLPAGRFNPLVIAYVRDGELRAALVPDWGSQLAVTLNLNLRGTDPYVLVRDGSVFVGYRSGRDAYVAIEATEWAVRVLGDRCSPIHWEGGAWREVFSWHLPVRVSVERYDELVTGRRSVRERVVCGWPVRLRDLTVWVFPLPVAPVVDAAVGRVIGWSSTVGSWTVGAVERDGRVLVFIARWVLEDWGPVKAREVSELEGTEVVPVVPAPGVFGVAFRGRDGSARVAVLSGGYTVDRVVKVETGEPLLLVGPVLVYRTGAGGVAWRCLTGDVTVHRWRCGDRTLLVLSLPSYETAVVDPESGRVYLVPAEFRGFGPGGELLTRCALTPRGAWVVGWGYDPSEGLVPAVRVLPSGDRATVLAWRHGSFVEVGSIHVGRVTGAVARWSGDAARVLVRADRPVLLEISGGRLARVTPVDAYQILDHDIVLAVRDGSTARVISFPSGDGLYEVRGAAEVLWICWTNWARMIAYRDGEGRVFLLNVSDGEKVPAVVTGGGAILAVAGDRVYLAVRARDGESGPCVVATVDDASLDGDVLRVRVSGRWLEIPIRNLSLPGVIPAQWYVVEDLTLGTAPESWARGRPELDLRLSFLGPIGPRWVSLEVPVRLRARSEGGKVRLEIVTPYGSADVDLNVSGEPIALGWDGLLTLIYREGSGSVHAALLSPWPVMQAVTDAGHQLVVRRDGRWEALPPAVEGSVVLRYLAPLPVRLGDRTLYLVERRSGYLVLDESGRVVGLAWVAYECCRGCEVYLNLSLRDGTRCELRLALPDRTPAPWAWVALPGRPSRETSEAGTGEVPSAAREVQSLRLGDVEVKVLELRRVTLLRIESRDASFAVPLPGAGWRVVRVEGRLLELARGELRVRTVLTPRPLPALRARYRGGEVLVERWVGSGYRPVMRVRVYPPEVKPVEVDDGVVLLVGHRPELALWRGRILRVRYVGPDVLVCESGGETAVVPFSTSLPPEVSLVTRVLTVPGSFRELVTGDGITVIVTDRTMLALDADARPGHLELRRELSEGVKLVAFKLGDEHLVAIVDEVGRSVRVCGRYRSVSPMPQGLLVETSDGRRLLLRPVRTEKGWSVVTERPPSAPRRSTEPSGSESPGKAPKTASRSTTPQPGKRWPTAPLPAPPVVRGRRPARRAP